MADSPPMSLGSVDRNKILKDTLYFALVPLTFYLTAVLGLIQLPHHVISLKDFIPTNDTVIVTIAWGINQILNVIRKYVA